VLLTFVVPSTTPLPTECCPPARDPNNLSIQSNGIIDAAKAQAPSSVASDILGVKLRPEAKLLLRCARSRRDAESCTEIKTLVREDIDWGYLIQAAYSHRMMPFLYLCLNTLDPTAVPKATMECLRLDFCANALHNIYRSEELVAILELFEKQSIPAIPFKGPVLAASVYCNLALRTFDDLDILVAKKDLARAKELLVSRGYHVENKPRYAREYTLIAADKRIMVDLHWGLTGWPFPFPVDLKIWWGRLEPVTLFGTTVVHSFSPSDLLLYLCCHGANQLAWICDVAELLRIHPELDLEKIVNQAGKLRVQRMLFLGLQLARNLVGSNIPQRVLLKIQADTVSLTLAKQFQQRLFDSANGAFMGLAGTGFGFKQRECLLDRVCHLVYRLDFAFFGFPDHHLVRTDESGRSLGLSSVAWNMLRPIRLARRYGARTLTHLFLGR
jgi:hypothetical protein